ncbi:MAG: nitronate monooxygenase [Thermoleophilaceae bacterium]
MRELLTDRLESPVVQAGMGGGLSGSRLAAAVSAAGGLGTIGFAAPDVLGREIAAARRLTDAPLAVNLLLPFARRGHFEAAAAADVLVTFWGRPKRRTAGPWMHQCGSLQEALAAHAAGADAVIAQGVEAGGHVRGSEPGLELLDRLLLALPAGYPVLAAGGVADRADVVARLDAGAAAVVCGTRFLMTDESGAHPAYKQRLLGAGETTLTELFGAGWAGAHRVVANAATERWLGGDPRGPRPLRAFNRATAPLLARAPAGLRQRMAGLQRPHSPLLGPIPPTAGAPPSLLDAGPLYAGESVARIGDIRPAADVVRDLTP